MRTELKFPQSNLIGALPGDPWVNTPAVDGDAEPWIRAPVGQEYWLKDVTNNLMKRYRKQKADSVDNDWGLGFHEIRQTITQAQFTDGGSTSGTKTLTETIPIGAFVLRVKLLNVTGFTGDTSATVQIGDGSDVDRYNAGTPSVFTTSNAIDGGAPSGTQIHTAAATVTVTVTSNADFTNVAAGQMTVCILYWG